MESKTHQETVQRTVDTHKTGADRDPPSNDADQVSPHLDEAKHEAGRAADAASPSVSEAGKAAKGSLTKAGEAVVNLVKSHLPRVEHEEESEEERQSKALLDEAMGRGDEPVNVNVNVTGVGENVVAEENKPLGGALVDQAQREAAEAREYLM
jgi:hypothetical protein